MLPLYSPSVTSRIVVKIKCDVVKQEEEEEEEEEKRREKKREKVK